jgi:hypothetical protein
MGQITGANLTLRAANSGSLARQRGPRARREQESLKDFLPGPTNSKNHHLIELPNAYGWDHESAKPIWPRLR